jgi:Tfp pilus assembly protein PilN
MQIPVNLASQPFRRDRPMLIASAAAGVLLFALLCLLVSLNWMERGRLAAAHAGLAQMDARLRAVAAQQAKLDAVLRRPENAQVLEYSYLVNTLLYRKGISWTRIFSDLETVLPHNVRVIAIRPAVTEQNQIVLEMSVGAEETEPVLRFLMKLESSDLFGHFSVSSILPPSQSEPLYRYKINVNYAQKL